MLSSSELVVNVSFGVTAANVGSLAPSAGWWNRAGDSSFSIHSEVGNSMKEENLGFFADVRILVGWGGGLYERCRVSPQIHE